nr:DUF1120 domain-containing protein [uncultured Pseudomonas sp.]
MPRLLPMKEIVAATLAFLVMASAPYGLAASSVDLSVKGLITPSTCTPTLSQGGLVDYGKLSASSLSADVSTWLAKVTLQLRVDCEADTLFALRGIDNRAGTAHTDDGYGYGLGLINGNQKLGTYLLTVNNSVSQGRVLRHLTSGNGGESWVDLVLAAFLSSHQLLAYRTGESGVPTPTALSNVTSDLNIRASIAPASGLTLTEEVALDGSASIEVLYL